ncbi:MAG TPA: thymidine phosphorylase [Longimicrobiales bacterium]|nr:thymidine phosphorylase [Longimicrobiales bacterium]
MRPYALILKKRDGEPVPPEALREFLRGYDRGTVPDYQMAAFLMAVQFRGLSSPELQALVEEILASGGRVDFGGAPGRRVDKHSTGGVGDKVSLVLAPLVASLGVQVPMMSGRGLGHSGGTVDKLESIPGFTMALSLERFRAQVLELGTALISQTPEIAPLDGKLYALRDVTGTVASIPLIAASIMSKKVAEGIDGLVLDVKAGNGAFLPEEERVLELAGAMIAIGEEHGLEVVALVTAMDRPLGVAVGNALEVAEAVDALRGGGPPDLREVTVALASEMLVLGRVAATVEDGRRQAEAALGDGRALATMRRVVEAQGGDGRVIDDPGRLPKAPVVRPVSAGAAGRVEAMDTRAIGEAAVGLGAGRTSLEDRIDPRVGFRVLVGPGDRVSAETVLAEVHAADEASAERAAGEMLAAVRVGDGSASPRPLISHRVTAAGVERLG